MSITREESTGDKKYVQKSSYEGETRVDEVVGNVIKSSKY